ncbi:zinc finger BED domain-containing 1-like protein [Labeo rohita]|uniref:Zinc finger BED domain-containing 1-like protein n=1 Tax=Labeo rohita TaxID=84645 RepID=A0A498P1X5_LABRO|nr:zinc finger BED domain-containing 1-like protein [Labeo rohita]
MCSVLQGKYEPAALQELLEKACFLDPRYRGDYINDTETKSKLIEEMVGVEDEGSAASASVVGDEEQAVVPPAAKKKTLGDLLKSRTTSASAPIPKRVRADNELTRYLQEECIDSIFFFYYHL